jgi:hypothetical protein
MPARIVLASLAAAALIAASQPAAAFPGEAEARWCSVRSSGIADVRWDCRYPTLALCADAVGVRNDMCLQNPNWRLRSYRR